MYDVRRARAVSVSGVPGERREDAEPRVPLVQRPGVRNVCGCVHVCVMCVVCHVHLTVFVPRRPIRQRRHVLSMSYFPLVGGSRRVCRMQSEWLTVHAALVVSVSALRRVRHLYTLSPEPECRIRRHLCRVSGVRPCSGCVKLPSGRRDVYPALRVRGRVLPLYIKSMCGMPRVAVANR